MGSIPELPVEFLRNGRFADGKRLACEIIPRIPKITGNENAPAPGVLRGRQRV